MKTFKLLSVILAASLMTISCVENSGKYQALLQQSQKSSVAVDSLKKEKAIIENEYNKIFEIINQVESTFAEIKKSEQKLNLAISKIENGSENSKETVVTGMKEIQKLLTQNRSKIRNLQKQLNETGNTNKSLADKIISLEQTLNDKIASINVFQDELQKKDVEIKGLNNSVEELNKLAQEMQDSIDAQVAQMNTVYLLVANNKELKEKGVISTSGLFLTKVLEKEFDSSAFIEADKRELVSIPLDVKKVKILTNHPIESYKLDKDETGMLTLTVLDSEQFWSISKYLVIRK